MPTAENNASRPPALSAIIVSFNAGDDLGHCVASLRRQTCALEIIVVDNGSDDGSVERASLEDPSIRVLKGANDGFAGGANRGAAAALGDALLFLNADIVLEPDCVEALLLGLNGAAGGTLCAPVIVDGSRRSLVFGLTVDWFGDPVGLLSPKAPLYLNGCALAIKRSVFAALGGFDAAFFMFCEDLDLCWRALLHGCDVRVVHEARVLHQGGSSTAGGYVSQGRIEVTSFRIALRERNTLAIVVRCGPAAWLALIVPLRLLRIGAIALIALVTGRFDLARALAEGVAWNVRRLPELVQQRRAMPVTSRQRRQVLKERMLRDVNALRMLAQHGLPRFVDRASPPDSARRP
jgi:GT2 family glycosyltransferase